MMQYCRSEHLAPIPHTRSLTPCLVRLITLPVGFTLTGLMGILIASCSQS